MGKTLKLVSSQGLPSFIVPAEISPELSLPSDRFCPCSGLWAAFSPGPVLLLAMSPSVSHGLENISPWCQNSLTHSKQFKPFLEPEGSQRLRKWCRGNGGVGYSSPCHSGGGAPCRDIASAGHGRDRAPTAVRGSGSGVLLAAQLPV